MYGSIIVSYSHSYGQLILAAYLLQLTTPIIPDWDNVITPSPTPSNLPIELPIAAWFAIAIGAYSLIIVIILIIRQCALVSSERVLQ